MKLTVNAGDLAVALRGPCDRAKAHAAIQILKHIKFEAGESSVLLLGHDLDASSQSAIDADVIDQGACALPSEPLVRLVSGLPKPAHVSFELDGQTCLIKSGRSRYKLPALDAADMPEALTAKGGLKFTVTADDLDQLFVRPRAALNLKDPRPICNGIFLHDDGGKLTAVGTSGYMLMRFATELPTTDFKGALIPRAASDELLRFGAGEIEISDRIISISSGDRVYASKMIDAIFPPDYRRTIPETNSVPVTFYREAMIESLSRLKSVGDFIESDMVDITVGENEVSISVTGAADGAETIECESADAKFVCVRATQLLESLKVLRGDQLRLHIAGTYSAVRIVDPSEPTAVSVMMPCASKTREAKAA